MEHLSLEIFDLATAENPKPTGSKYAMLPEDASITITDTSEIFASGDVWSYSFTLNTAANAHIFGTAGEMHGSRLHEQINKRRARLWVEGLPLYLGYLKLGEEVDVDEEGNVEVSFESGQKTFEEMIEGVSAREVSVGDVVIGVALNRKRVVDFDNEALFTLDGLKAFAEKDQRLAGIDSTEFHYFEPVGEGSQNNRSSYAQRWPKLVKSHGTVLNSSGDVISPTPDYTNVQTPYDAGHPFCNINVCYPLKAVTADGEEVEGRGYTMRLAHGKPTVDGGDNQTRFNNAPNFYLLYFIDRLFGDMKIHISENQAKDVEDLRRVFMLNYGCFYEEIENESDYFDSLEHTTPDNLLQRYGQYYLPFLDTVGETRMVKNWQEAGKAIPLDDIPAKVLLREVTVEKDGVDGILLSVGSVEGTSKGSARNELTKTYFPFSAELNKNSIEEAQKAYSAYLAYATGDNYPNVEIGEVINAMKSMFGVRLIFSNDYSTVRIVLLRNIFRSKDVQDIACDVVGETKQENCIRGFRMTYGKGTEDTSFYYKGLNDLFQRVATTWRDTADKHDYSQWKLDADYDEIKQFVSAMNKICYVTPLTGNAYIIKVDEDEDVLFPSLFEAAGFMDAEDGDCSGEAETIEEVQAGASPVIMNQIENAYASLFGGSMKAPTPEVPSDLNNSEHPALGQKIATFGRATKESFWFSQRRQPKPGEPYFKVEGWLDVYISEGFRIRMEDNYAISNGGTPFDEADPGLQFGIMRSSGDDAFVRYFADAEDGEDNDTWEIAPGSGAVSHPDTCDGRGDEWDYTGSETVTPEAAPAKIAELFPDSDALVVDNTIGYVTGTKWFYSRDGRKVLVASAYSRVGETITYSGDIRYFVTLSLAEIIQVSQSGRHMFIEADTSQERGDTFVQLCRLAYGSGTEPMKIDDGVGSRYGRFSLKLRAEKMNPFFDPSQPESSYNRRYLPITNENLRRRGLADQFYKEYSYWVRNARIAKRTVRMELAQLLAIDKTKRVRVGDIMGFVRKMEFSVSNKTGLGMVTMEILYI